MYKRQLQTRAALGVTKPVCLMDLATIAARSLKKEGALPGLDESEEVNACTVKIKVQTEQGLSLIHI